MDEIDAAFDKIEKEIIKSREDLINILDKVFEKYEKIQFPKMYKEIGEKQAEIITRIFNKDVEAFYRDYTPTVYKPRNESLYDVLDIRFNQKGIVDYHKPDYSDLYDSSQMTVGRHGEPLFGTVFKLGYHGGARGISSRLSDVWGQHPASGVAYYRTGGWVRYPGASVKRWHRYGKWGKKAEKAKKSIYKMMIEDLSEAEAGEMVVEFRTIADKHLDIIDELALPEIQRIISSHSDLL